MSKLTIYSYPNNYRVHKAQIAAAYVGVEIKEPSFNFGKDNESDAFLALNPLGKVPCLETPQGPIFESNAIARYVGGLRADKQLLGANYYESALVAQWMDFSSNEVEQCRATLIYPAMGIMAFNQQAHDQAQKDLDISLSVLDAHLGKSTVMVGKQITLADISLICALAELYTKVLSPSQINKYPNVTRWFNFCSSQPEFVQVLGKLSPNKVESAPAAAPKQVEIHAAPTATTKPSSSGKKDEPTNPEIEAQATKVRDLKSKKANKEEVQAAIDELLRLKAKAAASAGAEPAADTPPAASAESAPKEAGKGKKEKSEPKKDDAKAAKKDDKPQEKAGEAKKAEKGKDAAKGKKAEPEKAAPAKEATGLDDKAVKAAIKEGGKKGQDIAGMSTFGVHFFCVTIESADGDMKLLDKVLDGMNVEVDETAEDRKGGAGDLGKMLFNANEHKLVIICHTPKEVCEKATAADWMEGVINATGATVVHKDEHVIKAELLNDPDNGVFTLKKRDEGMSASFAFLRSRQLMIEDDSEDDTNYAAAAGVDLHSAPGADY